MERQYQIDGLLVHETTDDEFQVDGLLLNEDGEAGGGGGGLSIPIAMRHYLRMMGVG